MRVENALVFFALPGGCCVDGGEPTCDACCGGNRGGCSCGCLRGGMVGLVVERGIISIRKRRGDAYCGRITDNTLWISPLMMDTALPQHIVLLDELPALFEW